MARKSAGKCISHHRVLYIEQWTPLGAFVTCICGADFFADQTLLDTHYLPFQYTASNGPQDDKGIFLYRNELEGR